MEMLTINQINEGLSNKRGVAGKIMNKRQMEAMSSVSIKEEVKTMSSFDMVCKFTNTMTMDEVYNTINTVETIEAEVVGIVGSDIEIGIAETDRVELDFYGESYVTEGVRYTDSIDLSFLG